MSLEDVRGIVYSRTADISEKIGWFLHYDPLIFLPLIRRAEGGQEEQVILSEEQKRGDFLKFIFKTLPKSMSRLDPAVRTKRIVEFTGTIIPQTVMAAQAMLMMGLPFNLQRYLTKIAQELDIGDWIADMFDDPDFVARLQLQLLMGPLNPNKGSTGGSGGANASSKNKGGTSQGVQNGGFANAMRAISSPKQEQRQDAQAGANDGQSRMQGGYF